MTVDKGEGRSAGGGGEVMRASTHPMPMGKQASADLSEHLLPDAVKRRLFELRVYQVELEMQNVELRRMQVELDAERARYFDLYDLAPVGYCTVSEEGVILEVNLTAATMLGVPRSLPFSQSLLGFVSPDDQGIYFRSRKQLLETGQAQVCELQMVRKDGHRFWVSLRSSVTRSDDAVPVLRIVLSDMDKQKQAEMELRANEEQLRNLFERASDGITILSDKGRLVLVNASFAKMHGYTPQEMRNMSLNALDTPEVAQQSSERIRRILSGESLTFETEHYHRDGHVFPLEVSASLIVSGGEPLIQAFHRDISERRRTEELVRQLAYYDPLTKLANRMLLKDRLIQAMLASKRSGHYGALLFIDLDHFKPVNDKHGHSVGDLLLVEAARRIKHCIRQSDTAARFGGDEFVVLLDDLAHDKKQAFDQVELVAEKIRSLLAEPYLLTMAAGGVPKAECNCTASIGVVVFLNLDSTEEEVLEWADAAMYRAKDAGRNVIRFHE